MNTGAGAISESGAAQPDRFRGRLLQIPLRLSSDFAIRCTCSHFLSLPQIAARCNGDSVGKLSDFCRGMLGQVPLE